MNEFDLKQLEMEAKEVDDKAKAREKNTAHGTAGTGYFTRHIPLCV